jgi:choline dehydrogenase
VFPEQISGHPTAPIAAMAAKLSDMMKERNGAAGLVNASL